MRLIEKLENLEFYATAASKYLNNALKPSTIKKYSKEIKEALNVLENIEEELGIDLITLFKALKGNNFYSKHPETGEVSWIPLPELYYCGRKWYIGCSSLIFNEQEQCCDGWDCEPKGYGKTWALTKEELEK